MYVKAPFVPKSLARDLQFETCASELWHVSQNQGLGLVRRVRRRQMCQVEVAKVELRERKLPHRAQTDLPDWARTSRGFRVPRR